ncbi:hypothetical protein AGMMS50289_22230 [Betaproteobacteria bacterium]|nr:hypothetical protein AGMMS50289_22230 [Betaproteobacteria bacterium]
MLALQILVHLRGIGRSADCVTLGTQVTLQQATGARVIINNQEVF